MDDRSLIENKAVQTTRTVIEASYNSANCRSRPLSPGAGTGGLGVHAVAEVEVVAQMPMGQGAVAAVAERAVAPGSSSRSKVKQRG